MKSIAMCLCLCLVASVSSAATLSHFGNTNPATEGWHLLSGVTGYAENDYWVTETSGYARWAPDTPDWQSYFADDWSLLVEARWVAGPAAESRATIFDGNHGKSTALTWDANNAYYYAKATADTVLPGIDPTEFNTYIINYWEDEARMTVHVNGKLLASMESDEINDVPYYLMYWGDNNSGPRSEMHWKQVVFRDHNYVPEPSTALLMVMGLVVGCGWRRRR